ncbi:hypothetical protein LCL96_11510 [Rossellomorea aquimaris]|uniref:hypothetical protein n=1 Tax=Rossellomorea TaxID=2837508 RepID=UPI001CD6763C|nr:hypothetical protein [Rossellomorea aquimaris]MCA1059572.1 hypothetical protein [Rossellomorea aquimaris]
MEVMIQSKWLLLCSRFAFTMLALLGLPFLSYLKTGRPIMEWSLIIGILVTLIIIYVNGDGYMSQRGKYMIKEKKKQFYHSISFWTALIYTMVAFYLTMKAYGNFLF